MYFKIKEIGLQNRPLSYTVWKKRKTLSEGKFIRLQEPSWCDVLIVSKRFVYNTKIYQQGEVISQIFTRENTYLLFKVVTTRNNDSTRQSSEMTEIKL